MVVFSRISSKRERRSSVHRTKPKVKVVVLERLFRTGQTVRFATLDARVHGRAPTVYGLEVVV
jgi:hypothetical protein